MEKKIKHRIIGGLVIIALGIIILPLLQTKSDFTTQVTVVKAPPFPDQAVVVSAADSKPLPIAQDQSSYEQNINEPHPQQNESNNHPNDILSSARPSVVKNEASDAYNPSQISMQNAANTPKEPELQSPHQDDMEVDQSVYSADEGEEAPQVKLTEHHISKSPVGSQQIKKAVHTKLDVTHSRTMIVQAAKIHTPTTTKVAMNDNGLFDLSKAAWVIQIGSFKNKANALHLVNQLRANGYRAFIQKISTAFGDNTRVFVGPENKIMAANVLANRLENEMHVKGIVISYQPLTL
jgi:DedD protein